MGRVVIDRGGPALAWHHWLADTAVVEVLPARYVRPFPGYLDLVLTYEELGAIVESPGANRA